MIRAPAAIALETLVRSCSIASASAGAAAVDVEVAGDPDGGEAGQVAVVVDVQDLGQLVVVDDRERQEHLPAGRRGGLQQVLLRARRCGPGWSPAPRGWRPAAGWSPGRTAGRSSRRAAASGPTAPRPGCRCPSSRSARRRWRPSASPGRAAPPRCSRRACCRRTTDSWLGRARRRSGSVRQVHQAGVQPVVVRVLGGQRALDLLVGDDPPGGGVDEEHPARLQPALGDDVGRRGCRARRPRWPARRGRPWCATSGPGAARCGRGRRR